MMLKLRNGNIRLKGGKRAKTGIIKTAALIKKKKQTGESLEIKLGSAGCLHVLHFFFKFFFAGRVANK